MKIHQAIQTVIRVSFFGVFLSLATLLWQSYPISEPVAASAQTNLRLEASFLQDRYVKHEPIGFRLKLSNPTSDAIDVRGPVEFDPRIDFLVQRESGSEVRWMSKDYYGYGYRYTWGTSKIQPGQAREVQYLIDEGFANRMFAQPGRYRVRVEFAHANLSTGEQEGQPVSSDYIIVETEEPTGINLFAYNYITNVIDPERGNLRIDDRLPALRHFFNTFRGSVYWKYLAFELGNTLIDREQFQAAEDVFYDLSDIEFYHSKRVDEALGTLAGKLSRASPRTRRARTLMNSPVARPIPSPSVRAVPITPLPTPVTVIMPNPRP